MTIRYCTVCGKPIPEGFRNYRYCSDECRRKSRSAYQVKWAREHYKSKANQKQGIQSSQASSIVAKKESPKGKVPSKHTSLVPDQEAPNSGRKLSQTKPHVNNSDVIIGEKRDHLTAIRPTQRHHNGSTVWEWRCECGALVYKTLDSVEATTDNKCPRCVRNDKLLQTVHMLEQSRDNQERKNKSILGSIISGKLARNNSSGIRGVSWLSSRQCWIAYIFVNGRSKVLGCFDSIEEAADAREKAVVALYGSPEKEND